MRLRRMGFLLALIVSVATFAYSLTGIVSAGDDLREAAKRVSGERQPAVSHERCREAPGDSVRL
jgi:hypothetical protein